MPRRKTTIRHARKCLEKLVPLFPGYIFVELDPDRNQWRSVNGTIGVRNLISGDGRPLPVPVGFVEKLLALSGDDGCISFGPELRSGQEAAVLSGPFGDQIVTILSVDARGRVKVLMSLLSGFVTVETSASNLMPV